MPAAPTRAKGSEPMTTDTDTDTARGEARARGMRAYLIDPEARTVSAVVHTGHHTDIYRHIGAGCFDAVRFDRGRGMTGDVAYVDDNGLLRPVRHFFWIEGYPHPTVGKALVLGTTRDGDSRAPRHSLEEITRKVEFGQPVRVSDGERAPWLVWMPASGGPARSLEGV